MSNLSVDAEEALLRSSCKIRAAWALDAGIPWNLWTLRLLAGRLCLGPLGLFFSTLGSFGELMSSGPGGCF